jgi:chromosome segregation ATPase
VTTAASQATACEALHSLPVPEPTSTADQAVLRPDGEADRLRAEVARLRAENEGLRAERAELGEEVLRLRDAVVGRDAELGTARGRLAELEGLVTRYEHAAHRLDDVLQSKSWKLMWAAGAPVRKVRERSKGD